VYRIWREERRLDYRIIWAATVLLALSAGFVWTAAFALLLRTLNGYLVALTENRSKQELSHLFNANMHSAWRLVDGVELETPIDEIKAGDLVVVQAGQTVPVDGIIEDGAALLDQHMLTGEAEPAERTMGDTVLASTLLLAGRIVARVQRTGKDTLSADIVSMLGQTSDFKRTLQSRTDRWLNLMALPVVGLGLMALPAAGASGAIAVLWYYPGGRMLVYGPLSMLTYLQLAARRGILVKDGRALEVLQQVDAFVFDKTGTLTQEQPRVVSVEAREGHDAHTVLAYAAAAEARHGHPIARAIREAALEWGCSESVQAAPAVKVGFGVTAKVEGVTVRVGSARYLASEGVSIELDLETLQQRMREKGHSLILVAFDDRVVGVIELETLLRSETANVIGELQKRGMHTVVISGDEADATARLAKSLGIDRYFAEVLPQEKAKLIRDLQAEGRKVCFVGDGINDAIALKSADVAISLRGATTLATDTAQIVLMDGNLRAIPELMQLTNAFEANMRLNLAASLLPATLGVLGTFAFGWGLPLCVLLVQVSTPVGLYNAVRPIIGERRSRSPVVKE
jgi:Cu2+-exporting ATPase